MKQKIHLHLLPLTFPVFLFFACTTTDRPESTADKTSSIYQSGSNHSAGKETGIKSDLAKNHTPAPTPPKISPDPGRTAAIAARLEELQAIPLTVEGRKQSLAWIHEFDRDFPASENDPPTQRAFWIWMDKRARIFQATKEDFMKELDALPGGPDAAPLHEKLLAETFPYPGDKTMGIYLEYRAAAKARQKSFVKRFFSGVYDAIIGVGEGISGTAHDIVHGDGEASGP
ncbi:MAG: hypothetical protein AB7S78_14265 [Candidatus Omnitrophota bacterium]